MTPLEIANNFATAQLLAIRLSRVGGSVRDDVAEFPVPADVEDGFDAEVEAEDRVTRMENAELFAIGHGDL